MSRSPRPTSPGEEPPCRDPRARWPRPVPTRQGTSPWPERSWPRGRCCSCCAVGEPGSPPCDAEGRRAAPIRWGHDLEGNTMHDYTFGGAESINRAIGILVDLDQQQVNAVVELQIDSAI